MWDEAPDRLRISPITLVDRWRKSISRRAWLAGTAVGSLSIVAACRSRSQRPEVVAYVALDAEFSEPLLKTFGQRTGIDVRPVFDVESTKTVGLVNRLIAERRHPRCDVFWNNEILHTIRLKKKGLLDAVSPPADFAVASSFRDPDRQWYGLAARARVFLVRRDLPVADRPESILDLADARSGRRGAMARPLFGTTATHAAVLFSRWGEKRALRYYRDVRRHSRIYAGNRQVAEGVARGEVDFGITDTDDAIIQIEKGAPVEIVFPDQGEDRIGTLLIPNTVCLLKNAPHRATAIRLIHYILSAEVETRLAQGRSAQIPLRRDVSVRSRIGAEDVRPMEVDFAKATESWEAAAQALQPLFR